MKFILFPLTALVFILATGCATHKATTSTADSALDVGTHSPSPAPLDTYTPSPTGAPVLAAPDPAYSQTPGGSAAGGSTYTVKKGDTLYRIAKEHYGDGKQWQRIASANPGVTPQSLKVGQTLNLP